MPGAVDSQSLSTAYNRKYRRQNRARANARRRENYKKEKAKTGIKRQACGIKFSEKEASMPPFRKAFPTPDCLDDEGCRALADAILVRAAADYYDVCDHPDDLIIKSPDTSDAYRRSKKKLDEFIESTWFNDLTDIPWRTFKKIILEHKKAGHMPSITKPRHTSVIPTEHKDFYDTKRLAKNKNVTFH